MAAVGILNHFEPGITFNSQNNAPYSFLSFYKPFSCMPIRVSCLQLGPVSAIYRMTWMWACMMSFASLTRQHVPPAPAASVPGISVRKAVLHCCCTWSPCLLLEAQAPFGAKSRLSRASQVRMGAISLNCSSERSAASYPFSSDLLIMLAGFSDSSILMFFLRATKFTASSATHPLSTRAASSTCLCTAWIKKFRRAAGTPPPR